MQLSSESKARRPGAFRRKGMKICGDLGQISLRVSLCLEKEGRLKCDEEKFEFVQLSATANCNRQRKG